MLNSTIFNKDYINKNGVWFPKDSEEKVSTAFSDDTSALNYMVEDASWWFSYRMENLLVLAEKYFDKDTLIVDIGGGNGYSCKIFQQNNYKTLLIEPSVGGCLNAAKRGLKEVVCDVVTDDSILDNSLCQVVLLDVLEHIEDDKSMLKLLHKKLTPNGKIILTVPAFNALWSSEDDGAGHFRRYTHKQILRLFKEVGFSVNYSTYMFDFLILPVYFIRHLGEKVGLIKPVNQRTKEEEKKLKEKEFVAPKGIVGAVLNFFEKLETNRIKKGRSSWIGTSVVVVASKKNIF